MHVDYLYMAGIICKRRQVLQKIKHFSGAYLLKVFPTRHETQRKGILVIKHFNIYNCIKAASMALNKLRTIQTFQLDKSIENATYYYHIEK